MPLLLLVLALGACGREPSESSSGDSTPGEETQPAESTAEDPASECEQPDYLTCAEGVTASFEEGISGWAPLSGAEIFSDESTANSGVASLKVETYGTTGYEGAETDAVPVTPSAAYTASANVRAPRGSTLQISIRERMESGKEVAGTVIPFKGTGEWMDVEVLREFGSAGEIAVVQVRTDDAIQKIDFNVDDVALKSDQSG